MTDSYGDGLNGNVMTITETGTTNRIFTGTIQAGDAATYNFSLKNLPISMSRLMPVPNTIKMYPKGSNEGSRSANGEEVEKAFDSNIYTKYLNFFKEE